tara:strand:+ start:7049 stop:9931 length:2883 start_codon:yes stop_codon:yes gene_type:complete
MRLFFLFLLFSISYSITAQNPNPTVLITDNDFTSSGQGECNCITQFSDGIDPHFYDSGNDFGNYSDNENVEIVFCPSLTTGTKMSVSLGTASGFDWDVDGSDTLYVYDGPDSNSPLLGAHNSVTHPTGFNYQASWNNPSGCLTFKFVSDGAVNAGGWSANVTCNNPMQPFSAHMQAYRNGIGVDILNPSDTGYADICLGDSLLFVGVGDFLYDSTSTNPYGYNQSNNSIYEWDFTDGTSATGDSVWFYPPAQNGYLAILKIIDPYLQSKSILSKVRVSTIPSFSGIINTRDSICLGDSTIIIGGITATDTVGVDLTESSFQIGGVVTGQTFLPDGGGSSYTTSVSINGFSGQTINVGTDIQEVCMNIEHSYIGDLDIQLTCPNGTTIMLADIFGSSSSGSTFLGDANSSGSTVPGIGMDYCFTIGATWGTMVAENSAGNHIPSTVTPGYNILAPGDFQPEENFSNLIGCPIDGDWTITITDNILQDNGYIFEWGITLDPDINPNNEFYSPVIVSEGWVNDPSIISGQNDTAIVVQPLTTGVHYYTYEVVDNFGCSYDTTVSVYVLPKPSVMTDTIACNNQFQISGTSSYQNSGVWSWNTNGSGNVTFSPNNITLNPTISVDVVGDYILTYTDNQCNQDSSFNITFAPSPVIQTDETICVQDYQITGTSSYDGGQWTYNGPGTMTFLPNDTTSNPEINVDAEGIYTITYTDNQCNISNSFELNVVQTPTVPSNDTSCVNQFQFVGTSSYIGGTWTYSGPGNVTFTPNNTTESPLIEVDTKGLYTFTFTDNQCAKDSTFEVYFPEYVSVNLSDLTFCIGSEETISAYSSVAEATYLWNTGSTSSSIIVQDSGLYYVKVTGLCNPDSDSSTVKLEDCTLSLTNVVTPNGDGFNDFLVFPNLNYYPESSLVIFNRWGKKIYEASNYKNDWDGRNQANGTYFYILTPSGGQVEAELIKGTFTLLK